MKTSHILIIVLLVIIYRSKKGKPCFLKTWICDNTQDLTGIIEYNVTPREETSSFSGSRMGDLNNKYV